MVNNYFTFSGAPFARTPLCFFKCKVSDFFNHFSNILKKFFRYKFF